MTELLTTAFESGLGAVALVALIFFVFYQRKDHKVERQAWKDTSEKQFNKIAELTKESIQASEKNTGAVQALRDLIEGNNKRKDC